ncbi:MAG: mandelate racemase/muconate lactonizing enzyme family protein [Candidatus Thorarchaeota archaeon]
MSKIVSVKTKQIQTKLAGNDFITTYGKEPTTRHHVIVSIESDNGVVGVGEACPLPFTFDDDPDKIRREIDHQLAPNLIGKNPFDMNVYQNLTDKFPTVGGTARTGVDLALYDLMGKIRGVPVFELLGGQAQECVEIASVLGIGASETIAEAAVQQLQSGMRAVKIKVGLNVEKDVETLRLVREAVGKSAKIRADANTGYTVPEALQFLRVAEEMNLEYLEQPLPIENLQGFAQLQRKTSVPLMADESVYTYEDAKKLIEYDAVNLFGLKLIKHGGIFQTKRIAVLAEEYGIECVMISPWETQIGVSAAVHIVLSGSNFNHPHELAPGSLRDDPFCGLHELTGAYQAPTGTGLCIVPCHRQQNPKS